MFFRPASLSLFLTALGAVQPGWAQEPGPQPATSSLRADLDQARGQLGAALFGWQVSAFGDALSGYSGSGQRNFQLGAAELDLAGDLTRDLQLGLAVVKNPQATQLSVGFLDYHPFGGQIAPRGQLWVEKGFHVQVGRFDVPFGNDYSFYASKDSCSISRPLTTATLMDGGYNDAGIRVLGNNGTLNGNLFLLRGFHPGRLLGGRIGLTPFGDPFSLQGTREPKRAELGLSCFYDATSQWRKREAGVAVDADGRIGRYYLRAEYLLRTLEPVAGETAGSTRRGWQVTQEFSLQELLPWPTTLFARLERVTVSAPALPAAPGDSHDSRMVAGASTTLGGIVQVKLEGQRLLAATASTRALPGYAPWQGSLQLVVVF